MANQITHSHRCLACRLDHARVSPEFRGLERRLCQRCMDRARHHARKSARRTPASTPRLKAA